MYRQTVRSRLGYKDACCVDAMCMLPCCVLCMICQTGREIKNKGLGRLRMYKAPSSVSLGKANAPPAVTGLPPSRRPH
eukprot:EC789706.1.p2 GENE.EC789706.1~~EC789706.1.p2  ORF type:complete len:78 (+),score=18.46 EC789706.1:294-527(+)